jgi:hypothetical protein
VLMPLCNKAHWSHYKMVVQEANVVLLEVAVENGHKKGGFVIL